MNLGSGTKVLVTGADGFIGSHLTERLVEIGCDVRAFVFYNSLNSWGWLDSLPQEIKSSIDVRAGDIRDYDCVQTAIVDRSIVFHLAALIAIPYSYNAPRSYLDTNVGGTLNVLQAAKQCKVERVVQTSTSEVYGTASFVPISEKHPLNAQSPYAASKIAADQFALSFCRSYGTPVSIIRPFNTFGPRQSSRAIIPTIISQIAAGERRVRLGATHTTRDFTYVDDTVEAFIRLAQSDDAVGSVTNVGCNFEVSVEDLFQRIAKVMKADVEIERDSMRVRPDTSEVERLWCDNTRIKELTGWTPIYSGERGFAEGLARTAIWFADERNLAAYRAGAYVI
jgi:NAD dependent epimerase/dehydratase